MTTRKDYEAEFRAMSDTEFTEAMANFLDWPDKPERCRAALAVAVERLAGKNQINLFESLNPSPTTCDQMVAAFGLDPNVPLVDKQGDWGYNTDESMFLRFGGQEYQNVPTGKPPIANRIIEAACLEESDPAARKDFAWDVASRITNAIRGYRLAEFNFVLEIKRHSWEWRCLATPSASRVPGQPRHYFLVSPYCEQQFKVSNLSHQTKLFKLLDVLPIWKDDEIPLSVEHLDENQSVYTFENKETNTYTKLLVGPTGRILSTRKELIR